MKDRLVSLTWWVERQARRFREWLDPEPECTLPSILVPFPEWETAYRRALEDLAKRSDRDLANLHEPKA
jgi:hypothetical protein